MKQSISKAGIAVPQSFITKGKQRLKQYTNTVYLNNGDEFEIELFNPHQNKVLAKIELNGKSMGNGIVLRPGERVFLERYLDEARKFLFETYEVNGDNEDVKKAIANNGDVSVKFYLETVPYYFGSNPTWVNSNFTGNPYTIYTTNSGAPTFSPSYTTSTCSNIIGSSSTLTPGLNLNSSTSTAFFSNSATNTSSIKQTLRSKKSLETGRVEKGSESNQSFTYDNSTFNTYASYTDCWSIKPMSTKVVTRDELNVYCTECGAKRKKDNHKFCPHCGTKF